MLLAFDTAGVVTTSSPDVVGVVRNGAGDYSVTLDQPYPAASSVFVVNIDGAPADRHPPGVVHTSDTVKQILWETVAGVATDTDTMALGVKS